MKNIRALQNELEQIRSENSRLKEKVAELDDCLEKAMVPIHWIDDNGIILWANAAELDLVGYNKEEYVGSSILDYHVDKNKILDILICLKTNETVKDYPADIKCKDGSIKHVLISTHVVTKDGHFLHSCCFIRDITASINEEQSRNRLLQQLEENETKMRLAIKATKMGTWYWDANSNDIYLSEEGRKILGLAMETVIDETTFLNQLFPNGYNSLKKNSIELTENGKEGHFDSTQHIHKPDGSPRIVRVQGSIHPAEVGLPRVVGTVLDVTEMVAAHENDELLAAIIRSSNDAIVGKTLNGTINSWNEAAERIFGFSAQEMIGTSIYTIVPDDKKEEEASILATLRAGGRMEYFETKRLTKSGRLIDVSLTISPIKDMDGNIIGISKIARDITEKKQEEKRKHDFVTMVSHEIKTPLTSILLYTQVLLKGAQNDENKNAWNIGLKIEAMTKKIILMIKDYLSLSKIEDGKIDVSKEELDLRKVMYEAVEDAKLVTSKHDITIHGGDGIQVLADPNKLEQVFVNLLSNAIKYSPAGGNIRIECKPNANTVTVSVIDQGIGIRPEDQRKLFKKFARIDSPRTHTISGFGIGLYLVAEILRSHGTSIHIDSQEGYGSRFYFDLEQKK